MEIDFADAHGVLWKRTRKGQIGEICNSHNAQPFEHRLISHCH
jgi:hypothetical protein